MVEYNPKEIPKGIEEKWQKKWLDEKVYEPGLDTAKKSFYNLWMFPYPSAEGLHIGGARTFTGVDIYGRFKRMQGYDVFEPVGLDGFGIHSENYALKIGKHPVQHAKDSEQNFYRQLHMLGNGYAWDEKIETYDPEYYRWTQWIFVQMWKRNLAYRKRQAVNYCPKDLTVLADEQVIDGKCERCGTVVEKRELEQWFFKITEYADRLLDGLEALDWSPQIKIAQRNWIGRKEGIEITYPIEGVVEGAGKNTVTVFTTRPDTNFGATFIVIAPENPLVAKITSPDHKEEVDKYIAATTAKTEIERIAEGKKKTGAFTGCYAINQLTGKKMPIWISDFVLAGFGTGAVVGVPGHDVRDFEFAQEFGIEIIRVVVASDGDTSPIAKIEQVQEDDGTMVNSGFLDGMNIHDATTAVMDHIEKNKWGRRVKQYRLRDWLISRQRYWGPPIPMIFCAACAEQKKGEHADMPGWYAVAEKDLPVALPYLEEIRPTGSGQSPLASDKAFYETTCPGCGGPARRETDVSDTFLDSAWYFLRYPSATNTAAAWDPARTKRWLPVDSYIGGAEHAVLHLLYSRFVTMTVHDAGFVDFDEPFTKFRAHGLITKDGAKMSKSKGNVVNPDEYFAEFGADVMRLHLAFMAPLEQGGDFQEGGILGVERFLKRVWGLAHEIKISESKSESTGERDPKLTSLYQKTILKVTQSIESLHLNTGISALMILLNAIQDEQKTGAAGAGMPISRGEFEIFIKMVAPYAPYATEQIWREILGHQSSIHRESWPQYDAALMKDEKIKLVFQVNSRLRDAVEVDAAITEDEAKAMALANANVKQAMDVAAAVAGVAANGSAAVPKKIIYVEKKLVNIVI